MAGRELQTVSDTRRRMRTLSEKSARAGHRAVSLHRGCLLVKLDQIYVTMMLTFKKSIYTQHIVSLHHMHVHCTLHKCTMHA